MFTKAKQWAAQFRRTVMKDFIMLAYIIIDFLSIYLFCLEWMVEKHWVI